MSKTKRHRNRKGLAAFHRRIERGTDKEARNSRKRFTRLFGPVAALASPPMRPHAER